MPATIVTCSRRASWISVETNRPSRRWAFTAKLPSIGSAKNDEYSGKTTREAPRCTARVARPVIRSRFSTASRPGANCATATPSWTSELMRSAYRRGLPRRRVGHHPLLEQAGQHTVGERLAARLAGGAVLERRVGEDDLPHGVAADGAGLAGAAVHAQARLLLLLQLGG